jgi:hypothetical protein
MDELPVGRYGTIHYMSNNGSDVPLASYPVDEEVINLGRSDHNTCHIRLIDRWCSDIHCKLIFEEGKVRLNQTFVTLYDLPVTGLGISRSSRPERRRD